MLACHSRRRPCCPSSLIRGRRDSESLWRRLASWKSERRSNSIVTSVRSLERPAQNPKFARNLTRPTHFGICATQQLKRPSRISPLQPPSGMDDQMRSHHTALSLSHVKNLNYKIQYFYLAQYKTACSRVEQDRASSVHAGPADARGAGLRLPLRSCREPRKVAKAGFRSFREGLRRS